MAIGVKVGQEMVFVEQFHFHIRAGEFEYVQLIISPIKL